MHKFITLLQMRTTAASLSIAVVLIATSASAEDWNQILGPNRDGIAKNLKTVEGWPNNTPTVHWRFPLGDGFSGPVVVGNQVIVFHRVAGKERVESIDRETGKSMWRQDFDAYYRGGFNPDTGPRCVPLVVDDKVVVYGAAGACHAVTLHGGNRLWSRDLAEDYDAPEGYFGAGSSPIHVNGIVILNVGGRKNESGMVGLDLATGHTKWATTKEAASYSSPITVKDNGVQRVFAVTRFNGILLDPANGKVVFSFPFGKRGPTVNAATPLLFEDRLFVTASYGIGAELHQLDNDRARKIWASDDRLSSQYNTPIYHRSHFYGIHGREDVGVAELRCIDVDNGNVMWSKKGFGVANLLLANETMIAITGGGEIVLFHATPTKYAEKDRVRFTKNEVRALPAVDRDRLYVRDSKELFSIQIGG
ncbi:PQQ-binding-like beta-propeller repeat protein [Planctomycetota bacterium]